MGKNKKSYESLLLNALEHWYRDQCNFPIGEAKHCAEQVTRLMIEE